MATELTNAVKTLEMNIEDIEKAIHPELDTDTFRIGHRVFRLTALPRKVERQFLQIARQIELHEIKLSERVLQPIVQAIIDKYIPPNGLQLEQAFRAEGELTFDDVIDRLVEDAIYIVCRWQEPTLTREEFDEHCPPIAELRDIYNRQCRKIAVAAELGKSLRRRLIAMVDMLGLDPNSDFLRPLLIARSSPS